LNKQPIYFSATQQRVSFIEKDQNPLIVFSEQGLEFDFNLEFYYKLKPEGLGYMFRTYGKVYDDRINKMAQSILKDQAIMYTSDQYIRERERITDGFASVLKQNLESTMNITINLDMVVLLEINFPASLVSKNMEATLEIQNNILQQNQQNVDVIRATTDVMVAQTLVQANFTISNAQIQGNKTLQDSLALSTQVELNAHARGLEYAIQTLKLNGTQTDLLVNSFALKHSTANLVYGVPLFGTTVFSK